MSSTINIKVNENGGVEKKVWNKNLIILNLDEVWIAQVKSNLIT